MNNKYIRQGPSKSLKAMTDDQLKLLRRGLIWKIAPTYYRGTLEEIEAEMRRRGIPLKII